MNERKHEARQYDGEARRYDGDSWQYDGESRLYDGEARQYDIESRQYDCEGASYRRASQSYYHDHILSPSYYHDHTVTIVLPTFTILLSRFTIVPSTFTNVTESPSVKCSQHIHFHGSSTARRLFNRCRHPEKILRERINENNTNSPHDHNDNNSYVSMY